MRSSLLAVVLAACAAAPPDDRTRTAGLDIDGAAEPRLGRARHIYPTTVCDTKRGYLPYTRWDCDFFGAQPHDTDFPRINFWTLLTATRASVAGPTETPLLGGWVVSHYRNPEPITHPWAPGCQLLLPLHTAMLALPRTAPPTTEHVNMGAWAEGDTAYLLIRPLPATLGYSYFVQFVEWAPGENLLGLVTGHAVQLEIGNTNWRDR